VGACVTPALVAEVEGRSATTSASWLLDAAPIADPCREADLGTTSNRWLRAFPNAKKAAGSIVGKRQDHVRSEDHRSEHVCCC